MNPNKYIRKTIVSLVEAATGWNAYERTVPPDINPQPSKFILVNGTVKNRFGDSKQGHEWSCSTQIDIISIQRKGYVGSAEVDDKEEAILTVMKNMALSGFKVKFTRLVDSRPQTIEMPSETQVRTTLIFEQWLGQGKQVPVT